VPSLLPPPYAATSLPPLRQHAQAPRLKPRQPSARHAQPGPERGFVYVRGPGNPPWAKVWNPGAGLRASDHRSLRPGAAKLARTPGRNPETCLEQEASSEARPEQEASPMGGPEPGSQPDDQARARKPAGWPGRNPEADPMAMPEHGSRPDGQAGTRKSARWPGRNPEAGPMAMPEPETGPEARPKPMASQEQESSPIARPEPGSWPGRSQEVSPDTRPDPGSRPDGRA
jgi:hypothetical protein